MFVLLDIHGVQILIVFCQMVLIFGCSFFAVRVLFHQLFEICDLLVNWTFVVALALVWVLLGEALNCGSCSYFWNIWLLGAACFFIWSTSSCMCLFNKWWYVALLWINLSQKLLLCLLRWSLSCLAKHLRTISDHLFDWFGTIIRLRATSILKILLVRVWLRNIVSKLRTMIMNM